MNNAFNNLRLALKRLSYDLKKEVFRFIGDIKWAGITHPFWFVVNSQTFRLKGRHYREIEPLIQPGDIIIRRFEGYVDKWFIPGWWNHAGIYVGEIDGQNHSIVHAISDGVVIEDLIDFMRTDHMIVLRAPSRYTQPAIARAMLAVGSDYDFSFDFQEDIRFSCTELISHCYNGLIIGQKRFGRLTVVADDIVGTDLLDVVWDSRKD